MEAWQEAVDDGTITEKWSELLQDVVEAERRSSNGLVYFLLTVIVIQFLAFCALYWMR